MSIVFEYDLLQAGVHFGHQQKVLESKNRTSYTDTKKIGIINLELTQEQLNAAASKVEDI